MAEYSVRYTQHFDHRVSAWCKGCDKLHSDKQVYSDNQHLLCIRALVQVLKFDCLTKVSKLFMIEHTWETPGVVWIPLVSFITLASCAVTPHNTICIHGTIARIHAFLIPTCKNLGTLLVHDTLGLRASCVGVSSVGGWTVAPCSVVARLAECFNTTLGETAGIYTVSVDTFVCEGAFQVTIAASYIEQHALFVRTTLYTNTYALYMPCRGCPLVEEDKYTQLGGC